MALMKLSRYIETFAEGSRPAPNTVKAWIRNGEVVGKKIGGLWWVDPNPVVVQTDNELLLRILRAG